ncbi:alpha/beta hydrolase [Alkaliphilus crotonatoxidans]
MKKVVVLILVVLIVGGMVGCSQQKEFDTAELESRAEALVENMIRGDFKEARADFSREVADILTEEVLKEGWDTTIEPLGSYIRRVSTTSTTNNQQLTVKVLLEYEGNGVLVTTVFNTKGQVTGLRTTYEEIKEAEGANSLLESDVTIAGDPGLPLKGKLTLPDGVDNPPVVILVHGSGASDMDEAISGNTPFKDIAQGLADRGIATIRYNKRYYQYPEAAEKLGNAITLEDEVLEDVYTAIELAKADERINSKEIYVLGHSLGGSLAPAIADRYPELAGIISMAGTLRPLYEVSYDQVLEAAEAIRPTLSDQDKELLEQQLKQVEADIKTLRNLPEDLSDNTKLLDLPVKYWRSIIQYSGERYIDRVSLPILVLQGDADFQVYPEVDYVLWQEKLSNRNNATLHLYPGLNHLMMPTQNKRDLSEYAVKSKVDNQVMDDIAEFIHHNES